MVAVPRLVGDIVRHGSGREGTVVSAGCGTLEAEVDQARANVVLVGSDEPTIPEPCRALLKTRPHIKVVVIGADARHATLYERRRRRHELADVSPYRLFATIQEVLENEASAWRA